MEGLSRLVTNTFNNAPITLGILLVFFYPIKALQCSGNTYESIHQNACLPCPTQPSHCEQVALPDIKSCVKSCYVLPSFSIVTSIQPTVKHSVIGRHNTVSTSPMEPPVKSYEMTKINTVYTGHASTTKTTMLKQSDFLVIFSVLGGVIFLLLAVYCFWLKRKPSRNQRNVAATYQIVLVDTRSNAEDNESPPSHNHESPPSQSDTRGPIDQESPKASDMKLRKGFQETSLTANEQPLLLHE